MKTFQVLLAVLSLQACNVVEHEGSEDESRSMLQDTGRAGPKTQDGQAIPGKTCDMSMPVGLQVDLHFQVGIRPPVSVILKGPRGAEELSSDAQALEGWRIMESGQVKIKHIAHYIGAREEVGAYSLDIKVDGKSVHQKDFTLVSDGCHVIPQTLAFDIPSSAPLTLSDALDYYPLDGGALIALDRASGKAKNIQTETAHDSLEVVRELFEQEVSSDGASSSASARWERKVQGKTLLGTFHESGIDRGALPAGKVEDTQRRQLFGKASLK